ncbi:LOW QUALITY PROTEIN: MICOS complex subunit Mic60-like [Maniola hyperantus]|uniref:LOW QUALITY PROTEIN: MICOS complex subunit Mic60-like n=1 Tax=Aphantopus hyperantus TaxID=2795564 RepID=UPI003748175F
MYRFTNHLTNPNLVLVRKQIGDGSCAALIVMRSPRRQYAQQEKCPPNEKKPKSRKFFWGTVGATVLTGAAVVYAKSSPDARNWLESNAPWANDFVALVYQENTTYWSSTVNQLSKASSYVSNFLFGKEGVSPLDFQQRSEQDLEKDAAKTFSSKTYESSDKKPFQKKPNAKVPPPQLEPLYVEEKKLDTPEVETPATVIQTEKCEPQQPPVTRITKDMVELEHDMHENTKLAIDNYKKALQYCSNYNKVLYKVVESSPDDLDRKHFTALQGARNERDAYLTKAKEASAKAKCAIETLDRMIKAGVQAPPESIAATNRYIKQFRADLSDVENQFKECLSQSVLSDRYWNKLPQARKAYKEELQMMFPGLDLSSRQLETRGIPTFLLMYTLKQIQYLQNEIAELQTIRELKINRAIECHDEKAIIEAKVEDMIKRERLEKEREFQKKSLEVQAEANRKLKEQMKKQFEIQQEVSQDRLAKKEKEVMGRFSRSVSEQVEKERVTFKKELAAMAGKLQAIEQTLKQRAKAEAEARRSQSLWAAAEALHAATRRSTPETKLDNEIKALETAGKDDKLVQTVLKGINPEVREKGIVTEKTLRDRFDTVEKTAAKVALVGRDGASLPVYFLSWLQSKLIFQKLAEIPKDELDNQPTDFSKLDTFDIIQRARYHMDHGNLSIALRYVNLLQGAPRAIAKPWSDAARRHLEIKQAAEAVMAHASVSGLLYL